MPIATKDPLTVTVVGGGNSAHVLIPFLAESGHKVNLMTRRPAAWNKEVTVELHTMDDQVLSTVKGQLNKISSEPSDVIPEAEVIVLCMPVHQYRDALHRLAPFINRNKNEVFVGTIYGQAGFNWMVHEVERKFHLNNTVGFAVGLIPWICRTSEYGSTGFNYGGKEVNIVAVTPADRFERLNEVFLNDICYKFHGKGKFVQACSFLSLTLSVDNQFIHPSRCYGLFKRYGGKWPTAEAIPFFYKDFDEVSAEILKNVDDDYSKIREAVRNHFPQRSFKYMLDYLALERCSHKSENVDIQKSFQESKQLGKIKTPCIQLPSGEYAIDTQCRFFKDDIPYGLLVAKWVAEQLDVQTPFIDEVITWAQNLRNEAFIKDGKIDVKACLSDSFTTGIPPVYGIFSVDDILD